MKDFLVERLFMHAPKAPPRTMPQGPTPRLARRFLFLRAGGALFHRTKNDPFVFSRLQPQTAKSPGNTEVFPGLWIPCLWGGVRCPSDAEELHGVVPQDAPHVRLPEAQAEEVRKLRLRLPHGIVGAEEHPVRAVALDDLPGGFGL